MTTLSCLFSLFILLASNPPVTYRISATLNPTRRTISGHETITFRNPLRSPLNSIYLYLYPNAFSHHNSALIRELRNQRRLAPGWLNPKNSGEIIIDNLRCAGTTPEYKITCTILEILLSEPLAPGDSTIITLSFTTRIPILLTDFGKKGNVFLLSRWYPQVIAPDESGWHLEGFHPDGAAPGAFADYEIAFNLPDKFTLATPGKELRVDEPQRQSDNTYRFYARWLTDFPIIASPDHIKLTDTTTLPHINILLRKNQKSKTSNRLLLYTARMSTFLFSHWFGELPETTLTIVDLTGIATGEISAPGLVLLTQKPIPFLRLQERALVTEIARQWFCHNPAPNPVRDPLLYYGLPGYAATRYLEAIYGAENLLSTPIPFLDGASDLYLHQVYHYIAATNNLTQSLTSPFRSLPAPVPVGAIYRSRSVLLLKTIEQELGVPALDSAIQHYRTTGRGRHPTTAGFLTCLTHRAGPEKEVIIHRMMSQPGNSDLKIAHLCHYQDHLIINITARNFPELPLEVKTIFTDHSCRIDTVYPQPGTVNRRDYILTLPAEKRVKRIVVDPQGKILEPNRWNNFLPAQVTVQPIFRLPSFNAYQIFYGPWFWYDDYRGFQPGIWFQGRRFIDAGIIRGDHSWTLLFNYASHKCDWHTGLSYQTPLIFTPFKSRFYFSADNSFRDRGIRAYILNDFGPALTPSTEIDFGYRLYELIDTTGRDPRAWIPARTAELRTRFAHTHLHTFLTGRQELVFQQGIKSLLSQYRYSKISAEQNYTIFLPQPFSLSIRLFAGAISGNTPPQEEFYLSGGLSYTNAEPISWAYEGMASGQEHWHYDGDVNCRGYYGLYRHGRYAYGINIYLIPLKFLQPFLDIGNVGDSINAPGFFPPVLDAGIRLTFGPFYADFPFWKSHPEENERHFTFRWSLGFKLTALLGGG